MKATMIDGLVLLAMLALGIGCKKEVEEMKPDETISIPLTSCRIKQMVYKNGNLQLPTIDRENITVDGKSLTVSTKNTTVYTYDSQNRLIKERRLHSVGKADSIIYVYKEKTILVFNYEYDVFDKKYYYKKDTLLLNNNGFVVKKAGYKTLEYDTAGFLIKSVFTGGSYSAVVSAENIIRIGGYTEGGYGTQGWRYQYDSLRSNIPNLTPFYGSESRNLLIKATTFVFGSIYYSDSDKYKIEYSYDFYSNKQVRRRIAYGTAINKSWPFEYDANGIGVTDFTYDCP